MNFPTEMWVGGLPPVLERSVALLGSTPRTGRKGPTYVPSALIARGGAS